MTDTQKSRNTLGNCLNRIVPGLSPFALATYVSHLASKSRKSDSLFADDSIERKWIKMRLKVIDEQREFVKEVSRKQKGRNEKEIESYG
jgi:hypothetical protein